MRSYTLAVTTAPNSDAVELAAIRQHARIDTDLGEEDDLRSKLLAAIQEVEELTDRSLITRTLTLHLSEFPAGNVICLPRGPVTSITSVTYVDTDGATQTWGASNYRLVATSTSYELRPVYGGSWPDARTPDPSAVQIKYVAGYGSTSAAVPPWARQAVCEHVAAAYDPDMAAQHRMAYERLILQGRYWLAVGA